MGCAPRLTTGCVSCHGEVSMLTCLWLHLAGKGMPVERRGMRGIALTNRDITIIFLNRTAQYCYVRE